MNHLAILPLEPAHAPDAARLHSAGQPGTFLTSLGSEALIAIYRTLPQSPVGFGFAAVADDGQVIGFVSASASTGRLFLEMMTRRANVFLPILARRFAHHPRLLTRAVQAAIYPLLTRDDKSDQNTCAELLSIMVESKMRSRGLGAVLLTALMGECAQRGVALLDVTVDATNRDAQRFYERFGFRRQRTFQLFGRAMHLYQRPLQA